MFSLRNLTTSFTAFSLPIFGQELNTVMKYDTITYGHFGTQLNFRIKRQPTLPAFADLEERVIAMEEVMALESSVKATTTMFKVGRETTVPFNLKRAVGRCGSGRKEKCSGSSTLLFCREILTVVPSNSKKEQKVICGKKGINISCPGGYVS